MYELKTCSVCGATEIKRINTEQHDGLVFGIYRCSSCDAEISAYQKFLNEAKKAEKEASIKEETAAESVAVPAEEHVSRRVVVSVAADVYRKAIGSTIELAAKMDEINERAARDGGVKVDTLVAGMEEGRRSFRIVRQKPDGKSHARDIANKYGLAYEDLISKK